LAFPKKPEVKVVTTALLSVRISTVALDTAFSVLASTSTATRSPFPMAGLK
jgi:hypothetical protein